MSRLILHCTKAVNKIVQCSINVTETSDAVQIGESGKLASALNVPRGILGFGADPELPYRDQRFDKKMVDQSTNRSSPF
jgi:hypothetical protein